MDLSTLLDPARDGINGVVTSLLLHGLLFLGGGIAFVQPAQVGVESGTGGIEISLVAAPAESRRKIDSSFSQTEEEKPEGKTAETKTSEWVAQEVTASVPQTKVSPQPVTPSTPESGGAVGDGSSPILGQDSTTFYSAGGALSEGKSKYLKNPAPPYPWAAIAHGEEGLVVLAVSVDETGRPIQVEIEKSSGFPLLDESSLKTVLRWKFDPAHVGFFAVRSNIRVPVRFVLKKE